MTARHWFRLLPDMSAHLADPIAAPLEQIGAAIASELAAEHVNMPRVRELRRRLEHLEHRARRAASPAYTEQEIDAAIAAASSEVDSPRRVHYEPFDHA